MRDIINIIDNRNTVWHSTTKINKSMNLISSLCYVCKAVDSSPEESGSQPGGKENCFYFLLYRKVFFILKVHIEVFSIAAHFQGISVTLTVYCFQVDLFLPGR